MAPYKPINPRGFDCVNVLMQKAIKKVTVMARNRQHAKAWGKAHSTRKNATNKRYQDNNRPKVQQMIRDWERRNADHNRARVTKTTRERRARDPVCAVKHRIRSRLLGFLAGKGAGKADSTFKQMGCTPAELTQHLNTQLRIGEDIQSMELDHIFPMSSYNVLDPVEQRKMMHPSNLQPLTRAENIQKKQKLPTKAMAQKVTRHCWPAGIDESMLPSIYPGWATALRRQ